ncbi:MAG: ABC transporter permease, partial [Deltaproteobacteria bacterium]|nr:ABC transporter permease [Deltaproteobacteria bacterium]
MTRYIVRRVLLGFVTVWIVSVIIFVVSRIGPDPALMIASPGADEAEIKAIHERFG